MPITSGQISQGFAAQQSMFGGQLAYAQQLSYPQQAALAPGMTPPPPPPQPPSAIGGFVNAQPAGFGMAGEQIAASGMSTAASVGGMGMVGAQIYGMMGGGGAIGMAGRVMDPFTYMGGAARAGASLGGRMGMGMMGRGAMGAAFGATAALPLYGAYKAAETYGSAFSGGMQDQANLNQTIRSNFSQFGGGGPFSRGFSQQQMGQIGQDVQQAVRSDPYMSMGQATSLIGQGAQGGMFTGVTGASEFTQKFRQMLDTLKGVQKELGGSLTEAMTFINEAKQSGIFQTADRLRMAAGTRTTAAVTGLTGMQQAQLTQFGASLSRSIGGRATQGAFGAQRSMQQIGAAVQTGAINEEQIFNITGESGASGQMALTQMLMSDTAKATRRGHGRYSIFGLANEEGTGLDSTQMARFAAGDIGVGELSQMARGNVNRMGRARAINREGMLRGAALEQGGIGFQIGKMRQIIGDRALSQGDDLASLVLQRRTGIDRPRAELYMSMIRNQGSIARQESLGRIGAGRQIRQEQELQERSLDSTLDRLGSSLNDSMGVTATREAGQRAMTRISSFVEKALNEALGIVDNEMSGGTAAAMSNASIGRATDAQMRRIEALSRASGQNIGGGGDPFARGMFELGTSWGGRQTRGESLEAFGFDVSGYGGARRRSVGETGDVTASYLDAVGLGGRAEREGISFTDLRSRVRKERGAGMTPQEQTTASIRLSMAMQGSVSGADRTAMEKLAMRGGDFQAQITRAEVLTRGARLRGDTNASFFERMGDDFSTSESGMNNRTGLTAIMAQQGNSIDALNVTDPTSIGMGGGASAIVERTGGTEGEAEGLDSRLGRRLARFLGIGGGASEQGATTAASPDRQKRAMGYISRGSGTRLRMTDRDRLDWDAATADLNREDYEAAFADETIGGLIDEITTASTAGDTEAVTRGIANLETYGNTQSGNARNVNRSLVMQMRSDTERFNGRVGSQYAQARVSREERMAFEAEANKTGVTMTRLGRGIEGDSPMAERMRNTLTGIGGQMMGQGTQAAGYQGADAFMESMIGMSDEDSQEAMALLGSSSGARGEAGKEARDRANAMIGEIARGRQFEGAIRGEGRRGRRQMQETALSAITGGGFGDMEFTVGGRQVRGRNRQRVVMQALSGRGRMSQEDRDRIRESLSSQMRQSGISEEDTGNLIEAVASGVGNVTGDEGAGAFSPEEATRLRQARDAAGGSLERVRKNRMEEAQRAMSAQDPLSAQRNETLTAILQAVRKDKGDGDPDNEGGADRGTEG